MNEERLIFTGQIKKKIFITIGIGIVLFIIGVFMLSMGGGHGDSHGAGQEAVLVQGGQMHGAEHKAAEHTEDAHNSHGSVASEAHGAAVNTHGGGHEAPHWSLRIIKIFGVIIFSLQVFLS